MTTALTESSSDTEDASNMGCTTSEPLTHANAALAA